MAPPPDGAEEEVEDVDTLRRIFDAEQADIERSERVQQQLRTVLQSLQQRHDELEAEGERLSAGRPADFRCAALEQEVEVAREAYAASESRRAELEGLAERRWQEEAACAAQLASRRGAFAEHAAWRAELQDRQRCTHAEHEEALAKAKSMVTAETLERATAEAMRLRHRVDEQQAETTRLRQALMDSWAARDDEPCKHGAVDYSGRGKELEALDNVEEELKWLAKLQQTAAAEVHHVKSLERSEAALQMSLREASEEKAALLSARVDLGDTGKAMREAIASQSEGWVRNVGGLEEARRSTDVDRMKLINESADLQLRLTELAPELEKLADLEGRHAKLEAERNALEGESGRLRAINGALGAQLLGDAREGCSATEAVTRVLQLQLRLVDRREAHCEEKEKLATRLRALEREVVTGGGAVSDLRARAPVEAPAPKKSGGGGALGSLRSGLGKFRDAALG